MIICIKWVKIKLFRLTNNTVKRKYGIVPIGSWTFVNNSSAPIESNRFSKWQAHAYHRKVWVHPPPHAPVVQRFIDTLSSCLRDGTQESYLSSFFFQTKCFFLGGGKTKFTVSGAYIWHGWCKTHSDWHAWSFVQKFVLVSTFVMLTEISCFL